jgi:predicted nucleotide-binding protein
MTYFHVALTRTDIKKPELKADLDTDGLEVQFLAPYRQGRSITVNGVAIPSNKIERLKVFRSEKPIAEGIELVKQADRNSTTIVLGGPSYKHRAIHAAADVTDDFIKGPPGSVVELETPAAIGEFARGDRRSVFLVRGRNDEAAEAMTTFLNALDLKVVGWEEAVAATGSVNPHISDVLDAGFRMAGAAVVLLTGDDLANLHPALLGDGEAKEPPTPQPRPNVIFEAGMAWQGARERTLLVEIGRLRGLSDLDGVHVIRFDGSADKRHALKGRLKLIGLELNEADSRWLSAGRFDVTLPDVEPNSEHKGPERTKVVEPEAALTGIPVRWVVLARLASLHRQQFTTGSILALDIEGIAQQACVESSIVRETLSDLLLEGLVEGFAESYGQTAIDGACRITADGLRTLRQAN